MSDLDPDMPPPEAMDDTVAMDETVSDLDPREIFDEIREHRLPDLEKVDPESGRGAVATWRWALAFVSPRRLLVLLPGRNNLLVWSAILLLIGACPVGVALVIPEQPYVIAACLLGPFGLGLSIYTFRRWLERMPYIYRLLQSLGEDPTDILEERAERRHRKLMRRLSRAQRRAR